MRRSICFFFVLMFLAGCATVGAPGDPIHQNDLMTEIISDPPGAKIEINDEYVGDTPITLHINRMYKSFGEGMGTWSTLIIKANPVLEGQYVQAKFITNDQPTPRKIYFNMNLSRATPQVDVNINQ